MDAVDVRGNLGLGYLELRTALAGNDRLEEARGVWRQLRWSAYERRTGTGREDRAGAELVRPN